MVSALVALAAVSAADARVPLINREVRSQRATPELQRSAVAALRPPSTMPPRLAQHDNRAESGSGLQRTQ